MRLVVEDLDGTSCFLLSERAGLTKEARRGEVRRPFLAERMMLTTAGAPVGRVAAATRRWLHMIIGLDRTR